MFQNIIYSYLFKIPHILVQDNLQCLNKNKENLGPLNRLCSETSSSCLFNNLGPWFSGLTLIKGALEKNLHLLFKMILHHDALS